MQVAEHGAGGDGTAGASPRPSVAIELEWRGGQRFASVTARGVELVLDGEAAAGPSPLEALVAALGACGAVDVVDILRKGRQDVHGVALRVVGERSSEVPRRLIRARIEVRIRGPVERSRAERAVRLAFEKYCSVRASLDPAIPIEIAVEVEP